MTSDLEIYNHPRAVYIRTEGFGCFLVDIRPIRCIGTGGHNHAFVAVGGPGGVKLSWLGGAPTAGRIGSLGSEGDGERRVADIFESFQWG